VIVLLQVAQLMVDQLIGAIARRLEHTLGLDVTQ